MKLISFLMFFIILGFINSPGSLNPFDREELPKAGNVIFCAPSFDPALINAKDAPLFNLPGIIHFKVTTSSKNAQKYFDQGLTFLYSFNHGEAGRSFKAAMEHDSSFAMAHWGMAMVLGPNYNAALNPSALDEINREIDRAVQFSVKATAKERGLIEALAKRFPRNDEKDMTPYNAAYANTMQNLHARFPNDAEVAAIYADAIMNEHPWNFWLKDGTAQPWTAGVISELERMLKRWPNHPSIIHMYIHASEASKNPEMAIPYADKLSDLLPFAGHIVHMPSHTYLRTGDYHKAVLVNEKATMVDSTYIAQCKVNGAVPLLYYPHNIHFLAASAFLEGSSKKALDAAWMINRNAQKELNENITVQHYYSIPFYVMVHLGKWDDILKLKYPGEQLKYPAAIWHYSRGMAYVAKQNLEAAKEELWAVQEIGSDKSLESMLIWEMNSATQLVSIAGLVLEGEIAASEKNFSKAFDAFEKAIAIEDALYYTEPPDWFFSVRHSYGHWLIQAGEYKKAEQVYLQDLTVFKENGWALIGLYNSLKAQGRSAEAFEVKKRFDKAWKWADLTIHSSRI